MRLTSDGIKEKASWEAKGYALPSFDRDAMCKKTKESPVWVHFGAGNIFRAFHCALAQKLLNEGIMESGITVVEGFDYELVQKLYRPHDDLSILVTLKADGSVEKTVIGSIGESCILDSADEAEFSRMKEIFRAPSLQLATFTITEKGYSLKGAGGATLPAVEQDLAAGPGKPASYIGKVSALLYERYLAGKAPIAMVSTDNCSHNGDKLHDAVYAFAKAWEDNGKAEKGFLSYIEDRSKVSFPWSMIDKITPRPDESVEKELGKDEIEGLENVVTSMKTWAAPFVNAEECEYLVIEDAFPAGRPALEKAGVIFTDRETVDKVERMKVCTCLNPLHTSLAVFGCLLGFEKISEEMKDPALKRMVERIGYDEGLPVVVDPGVLKPKDFIDTVVNVRIPNPFMPDTPQRIATDTSQKLPIRFGETVKNYRKQGRDLNDLKLIPLVFAGYVRYLMALDDEGKEMTLSPDPLLEELKGRLTNAKLGMDRAAADAVIEPFLTDERLYGVNLKDAGLDGKVKEYFAELTAGPGAVRKTLEKYVL